MIAVEEGDRTITYAELYRRVCALGNAIAAARRDPDNQLVAALLEHGVDAVVGHLGALMAGLITAPMDAREPRSGSAGCSTLPILRSSWRAAVSPAWRATSSASARS